MNYNLISSKNNNILILILSVLFLGCPSEDLPPLPPDPELPDGYVDEVWNEFGVQLYSESLYNFEYALDIEPDNLSAKMGKAWCLLILDDSEEGSSFGQIETLFDEGVSDSIWSTSSYSGLAILKFVQEEFNSSIIYADSVLAKDPQFVFQFDSEIDFRDILLVKAQAQFFTQQYVESGSSLFQISMNYYLDPDADFWLIESAQYESFVDALVAVINEASIDIDSNGIISNP